MISRYISKITNLEYSNVKIIIANNLRHRNTTGGIWNNYDICVYSGKVAASLAYRDAVLLAS